MKMNQNIVKAAKKILILVLFLLIGQLVLLIAANSFLESFLEGFYFHVDTIKLIKRVVIVFLLFAIVISTASLTRRAYKIYSLARIQPQKCIVEDIMLFGYMSDGERRYKAFLLLKDEKSDKLYFTFDEYSLSFYTFSYKKMNRMLVDVNVRRKDGSSVEIGDVVYMYKKRDVQVDVYTDPRNNELRVKKRKIYFQNISKKYDSSIFHNVYFYEGAVEVEEFAQDYILDLNEQ